MDKRWAGLLVAGAIMGISGRYTINLENRYAENSREVRKETCEKMFEIVLKIKESERIAKKPLKLRVEITELEKKILSPIYQGKISIDDKLDALSLYEIKSLQLDESLSDLKVFNAYVSVLNKLEISNSLIPEEYSAQTIPGIAMGLSGLLITSVAAYNLIKKEKSAKK
jgi:hypothetical protein